MDDLISRQAVLDYVLKDNYYNGGWFEIEGDKYVEWLKALPSVQPTACIAKISFDDQQMKEMVDKAISNLDFSDLISRQAAIDAMINSRSNADVTLVPGSYTNGWRDGRKLLLDDLLQVVFELPSVQPEQKELTMEDVKAYCETRNLVVISKDLFVRMNNTADEIYLYLKDRERR